MVRGSTYSARRVTQGHNNLQTCDDQDCHLGTGDINPTRVKPTHSSCPTAKYCIQTLQLRCHPLALSWLSSLKRLRERCGLSSPRRLRERHVKFFSEHSELSLRKGCRQSKIWAAQWQWPAVLRKPLLAAREKKAVQHPPAGSQRLQIQRHPGLLHWAGNRWQALRKQQLGKILPRSLWNERKEATTTASEQRLPKHRVCLEEQMYTEETDLM